MQFTFSPMLLILSAIIISGGQILRKIIPAFLKQIGTDNPLQVYLMLLACIFLIFPASAVKHYIILSLLKNNPGLEAMALQSRNESEPATEV